MTLDTGALALVALFNMITAILAWRAAIRAKSADVKLDTVVKQTDGLMDKVSAMSKTAGKAEERTEVAAAKEIVRADAVADAKADAEVKATKNEAPEPVPVTIVPVPGKPLPVTDKTKK